MEKTVYVDEQLLREAEQILDNIGLDASSVLRMTLKRVVRDGGISFLVADALHTKTTKDITNMTGETQMEEKRIKRKAAINLFKNKGYGISQNVTLASKNRGADNYWANPSFELLKQDWYLILNDWIRRELHLFRIPAQTLQAADMVCRADIEYKIDLQIAYNDTTFTDNRSKVSFAKFYLESVAY